MCSAGLPNQSTPGRCGCPKPGSGSNRSCKATSTTMRYQETTLAYPCSGTGCMCSGGIPFADGARNAGLTGPGFPCCVWSPLPACHRYYPGRSDGACSLVSLHRQRPSLCNSQVGSCNYCFGPCSAFTHVMACTLAESPSDPFHRKLRQLRCLRCRFDCYRVERTSSRAGVSPAEVQHLFTAHCFAN